MRNPILTMLAMLVYVSNPAYSCELTDPVVVSRLLFEDGNTNVEAQALEVGSESGSCKTYINRVNNLGPDRAAFSWWNANGNMIVHRPSWRPLNAGKSKSVSLSSKEGTIEPIAPSSFKFNTEEMRDQPTSYFGLAEPVQVTSSATQKVGIGDIGSDWDAMQNWFSVSISQTDEPALYNIELSVSAASTIAFDMSLFADVAAAAAQAEEQGASVSSGQSFPLFEEPPSEGLEAFQDVLYLTIKPSTSEPIVMKSVPLTPATGPFLLLVDGEVDTAVGSLIDELVIRPAS